MSFRPVLVAMVLTLLLGTGACGKDEPARTDQPRTGPTTQPTSTATGQPSPSASASPSVVGLPDDFPAPREVPVVPGLVTSKDSGPQSNGLMGWQIQLQTVGTQKGCFDRAARALVGAGFSKRAEMTAGDTRQAQFTTTKWAVIISSRSDGTNCQLSYEVGQLRK
jgi:hypothetical protein